MFRGLQKKWNVSAGRLVVILIIFAIGGSLTGYAGRKLLEIFAIEFRLLEILAYILIMTVIWPAAVLLVSIPFAQFSFFRSYMARMGNRLFHRKKT